MVVELFEYRHIKLLEKQKKIHNILYKEEKNRIEVGNSACVFSLKKETGI